MKMNDVAIMSPDAPLAAGWVRLVSVSDTHNVDIPITLFPPGDLLIHAGDHTMNGLVPELASAAAWLRSLAARYTHGVAAIAGNHDRPLDAETWLRAAPYSQPGEPWTHASMARARSLFDDGGLGDGPMRLLQHSAAEVAGLKIVFVNAVSVSGDQTLVDRGGGYAMKEGFRPFVVDIRPGGRRGSVHE